MSASETATAGSAAAVDDAERGIAKETGANETAGKLAAELDAFLASVPEAEAASFCDEPELDSFAF